MDEIQRVPLTPSPLAPSTDDLENFDPMADKFVEWQRKHSTELPALQAEFIARQGVVKAAEAAAAASAVEAGAAAATATATTAAKAWVSGKVYEAFDCAISLLNLQTYRRRGAGSGVIDPSNDSGNWAGVVPNVTPTTASSVVSGTDVILDAASAGALSVTMTALGKSVFLPDATTLYSVGGPQRIVRNAGGFPFGLRDFAGNLLCGVAPGGCAYLVLERKADSAGVWGISGDELEPGLITVDVMLPPSLRGTTTFSQFVELTADLSIHFAPLASGGLAAFLVDAMNRVVSVPVSVDLTGGTMPSAVFRISNTSAILFYGYGQTTHKAVVLTLIGTAPSFSLSVGVPAAYTGILLSQGAVRPWADENMSGSSRLVQLSPTIYLFAGGANAASGNVLRAFVISVNGSSVSFGAAADFTNTSVSGLSVGVYPLTTTTALVQLVTSSQLQLVIASVGAGASPSVSFGGAAVITNLSGVPSSGALPLCLLSPSRAVMLSEGNGGAGMAAHLISINGAEVKSLGGQMIEGAINFAGRGMGAAGETRWNALLSRLSNTAAMYWVHDTSSYRSAIAVLTDVGGALSKGTTLSGSIWSGTAVGWGMMLPQGTSECLTIRATGSNNGTPAGNNLSLLPHSITGSSVSVGAGLMLPNFPQGEPGSCQAARLPGGDYVIYGMTIAGASLRELPVVRNWGRFAQYRGAIRIPPIRFAPLTATGPGWTPPVIGARRLVLVGSAYEGSADFVTNHTTRVVSLEIAI